MRAKETAFAVAAAQQTVELQEDEALVDIDYGEWTEKPDAEVAEMYPDLHQQWKLSPHRVAFPNGECLADVRGRIQPMLARLVDAHPGESIALASHRVPIKVLLCAALGLPDSAFWKVQVDTASISVLEYKNGTFHLLFSNETCHLKSFGEKLGVLDF
jgi:probable phosphoglycerate mutase